MLSLLDAAKCLGIGPPFSVVHDFFGFWGTGPRPLSLLTQLHRLQGKHVHLNFIRTGKLTASDRGFLDEGLQAAREILSNAGIGIGRVEHFAITGRVWHFTLADTDFFDSEYQTIIDEKFLDDLAESWAVPNDGIDIFVAHAILGSTNGTSPVGGSCDKSGKYSGLLLGASDQGDGQALGQTIAHELGHFFGLHHYFEIDPPNSIILLNYNLMCFESGKERTQLFPWQVWVMRQHCSMRSACEL